jgi:proline iminopeptidase
MQPYRQDTAYWPAVYAPRLAGHLPVGDGHAIWWEETGPADGRPVLVLHGGPGGNIRVYYRRLLDPSRHRGIFFDQRACGKSTYEDPMRENNTPALIADIEKLRVARKVDRWTVVGGSWGSTLALAYAQAHPNRVSGLVVSGVYLARPWDMDWWWSGWGPILPDVLAVRDSILTSEERRDPRAAFARRVMSDDPAVYRPAMEVLGVSNGQTLDLMPQTPGDDPNWLNERAILSSRIAMVYDQAEYWLKPNQLIENAHKLSRIPVAIVAGRNDLVTPPQGAWDLKLALPQAKLSIVAAAGHRWNDEALGRVMVPEIARVAG